MIEFQLFGIQHLTALVIVLAVSVLSYRLGRSRFADRLSVAGRIVFILYGGWLWSYKLSGGIDWQLVLPLQLCDLVYLFCLVAFWKPTRLLVTLIVYWGLGGTLQALLTPDILTGFPSAEFIVFFIGHSVIVWAAFFFLGWAPHPRLAGWNGWKTSFFGLVIYTIATMVFNFIFGLNYGYLSKKPDGASILDLLGPWPVYIFAGLAIGATIFAMIALALQSFPFESGKRTS